MSVSGFVSLCVYDVCLRGGGGEWNFYLQENLVTWRRGDYCNWQLFEQLWVLPTTVPLDLTGFGELWVLSIFTLAVSSSILFPLLDSLCSRHRPVVKLKSLVVLWFFYDLKKRVGFEEFGSSLSREFRVWLPCTSQLSTSFPPCRQEAQRKPLPSDLVFLGGLKSLYSWIHSLRCFSTCAECGKVNIWGKHSPVKMHDWFVVTSVWEARV